MVIAKLLGPPEYRLERTQFEFSSRRAEALFAYLAMDAERKRHARAALAEWLVREGQDEARGRRNLAHDLDCIRNQGTRPGQAHLSVLKDYVISKDDTVWLKGELEVDALTLDQAVAACCRSRFGARESARLEAALDLYGGPFMEGFQVRTAPALDDWIERRRDELKQTYLRGVVSLGLYYLAARDYPAAERWLNRFRELEPARHEAYLLLMLGLAARGEARQASAIYQEARRQLGADDPYFDAIEMLYQQLATGSADKARVVRVLKDYLADVLPAAEAPGPSLNPILERLDLMPATGLGERARAVLDHARRLAQVGRFGRVGTPHVLMALAEKEADFVQRVVGPAVSATTLGLAAHTVVGRGRRGIANDRLPRTPQLENAVELAIELAGRKGLAFVTPALLLYALVREPEGFCSQLLHALGVDCARLLLELPQAGADG